MKTWQIRTSSLKTSTILFRRGLRNLVDAQDIVALGLPVAIIGDPTVLPRFEPLVGRLADQGHSVTIHPLAIGEAKKDLATAAELYQWLGQQGVRRDTVVIAVGGGVLTDTVGYVAATYLRGLTWIAVPTTLLGQVDAAIGGKVAVNVPWGKNLVGAFHLSDMVLIDPEVLDTLPLREWQAGVGEVMKSALIAGGWLWDRLNNSAPPFGTADWDDLIRHTVEIKVNIVNADLEEHDQRMHLNFGHTVAHGLEQALGYGKLTHGEAVAMGCRVALSISENLLGLDPNVRWTVEQWMRVWELPLAVPDVDWDRVLAAMTQDKKARAHGLQWILLEQVGHPVIRRDIDEGLVRSAMERILGAR